MKKENSKFSELTKKMETLKTTEKGKLKGGITVLNAVSKSDKTDATNKELCIITDSSDVNKKICIL